MSESSFFEDAIAANGLSLSWRACERYAALKDLADTKATGVSVPELDPGELAVLAGRLITDFMVGPGEFRRGEMERPIGEEMEERMGAELGVLAVEMETASEAARPGKEFNRETHDGMLSI